jgi:acyl-CoA synthetase (AMP-forming)/AMP-acid ligase II
MSPRNSAAGIFQLLRASSCHRIVATCVTLAPVLAGLQQHIADVEPNFALDIEEIPSLAQTYPNLGAETPDCSFQPYSTQGSASIDDIALYMHSSGSSGLPKAIPQTHRALMEWASFRTLNFLVLHPRILIFTSLCSRGDRNASLYREAHRKHGTPIFPFVRHRLPATATTLWHPHCSLPTDSHLSQRTPHLPLPRQYP